MSEPALNPSKEGADAASTSDAQFPNGEQAFLDDFLLGKEVNSGKSKFTAAINVWVGTQQPAGMRREELALTEGMQRLLTLRNGLLVNLIRVLRLNPRESARSGILALVTFMAESKDAICYLTIKRTAKIFARTERSIRECVSDLERDGVISVKRNTDGLPQYYWPLIPHAMTTMGTSVAWFADALSEKPKSNGRPAKKADPKTPGTIVPPPSEKGRNSSAKPPEHLQHSNIASSNLLKRGRRQPPTRSRAPETATPRGQPSMGAALNPEIAFAERNVTVNQYGELEIGGELRERLRAVATDEQIDLALPRALERAQGSRDPMRLLEKINYALSYARQDAAGRSPLKTGFGGKTTRPSI
jgi:hypothetical protein